MLARPLPRGVLLLFQVLGRSQEATDLAVRHLGRDPAFIRSAASFFVENVLWADNSDHYRILGLPHDAPQDLIVENLRAALAWVTPFVGTERWEGTFATAVVAAGRAIGSEENRLPYDLATWNEAAVAPPPPRPARRGTGRLAAVAVASLAWFAVMSANLTPNGIIEVPTVASSPDSTQPGAPTEASPSIDVVRVKVVGKEVPSVTIAPPVVQAPPQPPAEPPMVTAVAASTAGGNAKAVTEAAAATEDTAVAAAAPDFETAFHLEPPSVTASTEQVALVTDDDAAAAQEDVRPPMPFAATDEPSLTGSEKATQLPTTPVVHVEPPAAKVAPPPAVTEDQPVPALTEMPPRIAAEPPKVVAAPPKVVVDPPKVAVDPPKVAADPIEVAALAPEEQPMELEPAVPPATTETVSPSFKCSRAATPVEHAICDDASLAGKDMELARLYRQVRGSLSGASRASVTREQTAWLRERDSCGGSAACILEAYQGRISELSTRLGQ